ncbi:ER-golgi trafficking TRAPP I complex 85 kDa subunit-domain-containing protein [Boletus edulis BED1]|uniref:ER-golgi trafficking TRAPP I complex 85 kDa subunit-domain-containing protein n=1 Tax=Boletus edulis BED1 TaxID=1328754 RepID=A0AAD4C1W2_BOLED|nr:ER-golgi trafficking TRAPP I complex 85 kDa subunit-domain-containing protein [Boletus edulis BED1]
MSPVLPLSLSPHVCLLPSPDLVRLLQDASLPPLHEILQSFSPLPQVNTRTTSLTTVLHPSFALRFSDLADIERICLEDDEKRAARTIDWIGERITKQCDLWLKEVDDHPDRYAARTPWWDELARCAEGDHLPSKHDGWNHPLSIILAVSTTAPNPLQAITALHSRVLEFPSWVDSTYFLYTLIVHPRESPLSDEEAGALFNAVKKQYGLHAFMLSLSLPLPPPPLSQFLPSRLNGPTSRPSSPVSLVVSPNFLRLSEPDIQQMARFTREFVVMSLVPWMEKCVLEWNETFSSSRRLPSRLFSSTRKFFGSTTPTTQNPTHTSSSSVSSLPSRSHTHNPSQLASGSSTLTAPPSQLRRLAEFATILGDYKLAIPVWESLRKENKGGSDILPLLLSPSPAVVAHASHALSAVYPLGSDVSPQAQVQALKCAVRWEAGISTGDFLADPLEGERWLVWAAGNAEEPPAALLLAQAAYLSVQKNSKRRAALWYLFAANRLEKCGIKPLTMFFLRKAHELFSNPPTKSLSPSFWISEGQPSSNHIGFDAVLSGIEHPLGRLLYTTGDIKGAVKFFLGQLRWSSASLLLAEIDLANGDEWKSTNSDKVLLEDFRVAFSHLKSISSHIDSHDLELPITFVSPALSRARLARDSISGDQVEWEKREEIWSTFWRTRGKETLEKSGRAAVGESFWVDIALHNPLDTEVTLTNLTLVVEARDKDTSWINKYVTVECVEEVVVRAKENRTLSIAVKVSQATSLTISYITYNFLGLFPARESLARRGRRLQDTPQQRQNVVYAPDILIRTDVEEASQELAVSFENDELLTLNEGEHRSMKLQMTNAGHKSIDEIWVVGGLEDQLWLESSESEPRGSTETLHINNKLSEWTPHVVPMNKELHSGDTAAVTLTWRPGRVAFQQLCLLFVYREIGGRAFHCTRVTRTYHVIPSLELSASFSPSPSIDSAFLVNLEVSNLSSRSMRVKQVTSISPTWECHHSTPLPSTPLQPAQLTSMSFSASPLDSTACIEATTAFISRTLGAVLHDRKVEPEDPPPLDLTCRHTSVYDSCISVHDPAVSQLFLSEKSRIITNSITQSHPHIPATSNSRVFPLFNPLSVDFLLFWEIPSEQRAGFILLSGVNLGASHAALQEVIENVESAKVKRSMYAETQREKMEILRSIRDSDWNAEMNPLVVTVQEGVIEHDFSRGIYLAPVKFSLRNHSLTHPSRYVIRFGRLSIRGTLFPSQTTTVETRLRVDRPGTYALSRWRVETDVGEAGSSHDQSPWRTRHRYVQGPPSDHYPRMIVTEVLR